MRLYVKTLTGKLMEIDIGPTDTIATLKSKISTVEDFPVAHQRLIFAGARLDNDRTVADYNISSDSTLHLIIRYPEIPWLSLPGDPHPMTSAKRRVVREIADIEKGEEHGKRWTIQSVDQEVLLETSQLRVKIHGPPASPYEGADFEVLVAFPRDYPFKPFAMRMCTPIYHPLIFFLWAIPPSPFICESSFHIPTSASKPHSCHSFFRGRPSGSIALYTTEGSALGVSTWSPAQTLANALRCLYAMLENPGAADIYSQHSHLRHQYAEYEEWRTKKEMHWDRARAAVQHRIVGKWSIQTHRLCVPAFKCDVKTLLLLNLRLRQGQDNSDLPPEVVLEIVRHQWRLHHYIPMFAERTA